MTDKLKKIIKQVHEFQIPFTEKGHTMTITIHPHMQNQLDVFLHINGDCELFQIGENTDASIANKMKRIIRKEIK